MAIVKPFKGLRTPNQEVCEELACLPYDVMNSEEAAQMAAGKPKSLLHVTRAEIDCPAGTDIHSEEVYNKSVENFKMFQDKGWLVQDPEAKFYIYQTIITNSNFFSLITYIGNLQYILSTRHFKCIITIKISNGSYSRTLYQHRNSNHRLPCFIQDLSFDCFSLHNR